MIKKMNTVISNYISESCKSQIYDLSENIKSALSENEIWVFEIPKDKRLSFKINNDKNENIGFIEISCKIKGLKAVIIEQNIIVTYFSRNVDLIYRSDWDSESVQNRYDSNKGRVMLKFHFDKKCEDAKILEPKYHFHIGGKSDENECYWHPKQIELPRLPYPPMDIIILCDIILLNYFPNQYTKLKSDNPEWRKLVKKSQNFFQKDYIENVLNSINNENDHEIYAHE